jgi:hypothetical protein
MVDPTSEEYQGGQQRRQAKEGSTRQVEFSGWQGIDALRKLHHLAFWLRNSPIHSDYWREAVDRGLGSTIRHGGPHGTKLSALPSKRRRRLCSSW